LSRAKYNSSTVVQGLAHDRGFTKLNKTSSNMGSIVSLTPIHDHQVVASPLSLRSPGVLTSAHINKLMIIAKEENHTQNIQANKGVS